MRINLMNQVICHPRTTFGAVIMNVKKKNALSQQSVDPHAFTPNHLLGVDLFILNKQSKDKSQRDSNDNVLANSLKV